jgi:WhiB family transcriptional regulator, redox-sensing transcriptional regulator
MSIAESVVTVPNPDMARSQELGAAQWMEHAACKGRTKLFFAPKAERPQARARREARARMLCTVCTVCTQCREFARNNHEYGYWGGESEEDRHLAGYTIAAPIGIRARAMTSSNSGN